MQASDTARSRIANFPLVASEIELRDDLNRSSPSAVLR